MREKSPIFAKPKLSITPIIAISEQVVTLEALNPSIYRYIGVVVSHRLTRLGCAKISDFREA